MKVVVFTGEEGNGGIKELAFTLVRTIAELGYEVHLFLPDINTIEVAEDIVDKTIRYTKQDSLLANNKCAKTIATQITIINPDIVICPEDCIISMQVLGCLHRGIKKCFMIHDVTMHPTRMNLKRRLVTKLSSYYRVHGLKQTDKVILLSENSFHNYCSRYPKYYDKGVICKLGAHPPVAEAVKPPELPEKMQDYYLFFGRIDKYKGVERLLRAYKLACEEKESVAPLLIAGAGVLSESEKTLAEENGNVHLMNRFIENGEMVWLFKQCKVVVLPYIEASQSGVIPVAYHYGKPVIASKIDGIKENVVHQSTGLLVSDERELVDAMLAFHEADGDAYRERCLQYTENELDWRKNIGRVLRKM